MSVQSDTRKPGEDAPTRIKVSGETADDLYARCGRRESYEDVIRRLLDATEGDR